MSEDEKHDGEQKELPEKDLGGGDVDTEASKEGKEGKPEAEKSGVGSDNGAGGIDAAQQLSEVKVEVEDSLVITPGSGVTHSLNVTDVVDKIVAMCMKYAGEGITIPKGVDPEMCSIVDKKVLKILHPHKALTHVDFWFVTPDKLIVKFQVVMEYMNSMMLRDTE